MAYAMGYFLSPLRGWDIFKVPETLSRGVRIILCNGRSGYYESMIARWIIRVFVALLPVVTSVAQERPLPHATPRRPATQPAVPRFIIGVFQQPVGSFDSWKVRGVNTLAGYEGESGSRRISNHDWTEAAAAKGFFYIKQPGEDLELEAKDPNLLGWMHSDEPDVRKPPADPKGLVEQYREWKKAGPSVPVFVNFSGGNVLGGKVSREVYQEYMKGADWVGNDFYAVTGYNRPDWLWKVGAAVDSLREWSGGKPQFAVIECSAQRLSWTPKNTRGVTADEFRAEVWHAVIHGVKGVIYFPQQIGEGFRYDAVTQKVALEMVVVNKRLTELGAVLSSEMNPHVASAKPQAAAPMEIGWRISGGRLYLIALNFSDDFVKGQHIKLGVEMGSVKSLWETRMPEVKSGEITDDFGPYEVRVYDVSMK